MSYYAELDNADKTGGDVATNQGWHEFCEWVPEAADELQRLVTYGWSQELDALEADLEKCLPDCEDANVKDVGSGLLKLLKERGDAEVIVVTDGVGVGADEDDQST